MKEPRQESPAGVVVAEHTEVTIDQVCGFCAVRREEVVALVEEGIIEPSGGQDRAAPPADWRFAGHSLRRAAKALRLRQDFELDLAAAALVLELVEEIERLRALTASESDPAG